MSTESRIVAWLGTAMSYTGGAVAVFMIGGSYYRRHETPVDHTSLELSLSAKLLGAFLGFCMMAAGRQITKASGVDAPLEGLSSWQGGLLMVLLALVMVLVL